MLNLTEPATVYGVEVPHAEGKAGMVAIPEQDENQNENQIDLTDLYKGLMEQLPKYARPLFVRFTKEAQLTSESKGKAQILEAEAWWLSKKQTGSDRVFDWRIFTLKKYYIHLLSIMRGTINSKTFFLGRCLCPKHCEVPFSSIAAMPCDCEGVRLLCRLLGQIPVAPSKEVQFHIPCRHVQKAEGAATKGRLRPGLGDRSPLLHGRQQRVLRGPGSRSAAEDRRWPSQTHVT